jgi:uncharacterized protein YqiB (DUF1249 family)
MKNKKCVTAGKKGANARWKSRYDLIDELRKYYGDNKSQMDEFQFKWKTFQLQRLIEFRNK